MNVFKKLENIKNKKLLVLLIAVLAVFTRFYELDARPMDHDESIHAYLSYILMKDGYYRYDPAYHGPFLYYTTAAVFFTLGDSEITARLIPVIFSLICVFISYKFKRWLNSGVYLLLFVTLFSTSILYYSRYMRNDIILVASFLAVVYFYFRYLEAKRPMYLAAISFLFGIILTSKENGYIYLFIFTTFLIVLQLLEKLRIVKIDERNPKKDPGIVIKTISVVIPFIVVFVALYTNLFSNMEGLKTATIDAVSHWVKMHERKDHWKPIYYYFKLLIQYEFLPLGLSLIAIPVFLKRLLSKKVGRLELFSFYWLLMAFAIYHYIAHKVPWLLLHLVAPLGLFSSIYVDNFIKKYEEYFKLLVVAGALVNLVVSLQITYVNYNDTSEDLIYIQIQPPVIDLTERIIKIKESGKCIAIYEPTYDYWPLPWYLRHHEDVKFISYRIPECEYVVTSEKFIESVKAKGYEIVETFLIRPGHYLILTKRC